MALPELTPEDRADLVAELGQIRREKARIASEAQAEKLRNTNTADDVGKAALYAVPKAAVGLAGFPGDVRDLAKLARDKVSSVTDEYAPDWLKRIGTAATNLNPAMNIINRFPTSGDLRAGAEKVTGPWPDPVTRAGQITDTGVQAGATMGRSLVRTPWTAAKVAAGVTAGTEGAGYLSGDNPWARAAGGLLGGGFPAFEAAMRDRTGKLARQALGEDLTPAGIARAQAMEDAGHAAGIPLMANESFDRGHGFVRALMNHPASEPIFRRFLADRPAQVQNAAESQLLAMTGPLRVPAENAATAERVATDYASGAQKLRTAVVTPSYNAAAGDTVSPLVARLMAQQEQGRFPQALAPGEHEALGQQAQALSAPEAWNARFLDDYYKRQRNAIDNPGISATGAQKSALNATMPTTNAIGAAAAQSPNIARGRADFQRITENVIDPLMAGPIGRIAGPAGHVPGTPTDVGRVMTEISGENVRAPQIREVHQALNGQDPAAFRGMAQTHFEQALKEASSDLITGPSNTLGAKFAKVLAGDPVKRQNLEEIVRGVAEGSGRNADDAVRGVNTLMEVMRRTGRTPGAGSPTHLYGETQREMSQTVVGDLLKQPFNPLKRLGTLYDDVVTAGRYKQVATAMTSERAVDALVKMAKLNPSGVTAQYYAAVILGLDKAAASTTAGAQ